VSSSDFGIAVRQIPDAQAAIGLAASYVSLHPPFDAYRAGRLIGTIAGQVDRGHYAFAVKRGRIVGYCGWALCHHETAEAWLAGGEPPTSDACLSGDVVVLTILAATETSAVMRLTRHLRQVYSGRTFMARRLEGGEKGIVRGAIGPSHRGSRVAGPTA
jgi:hemolysin-activating ACP:hemolysin acyltransferase